jgi:hypothetical protein|tara:strand:+ start:132 stop:332 length:201 start_codon:yes stop_codon:yes gene_type:complete
MDRNFTDLDGLRVKNGRLINDRYPSESGIAKAARIKRAVDNDRKVNQIAEGIEVAENMKNFRQLNF